MKLTLQAGDRSITWPDVDPVRFCRLCQRIREECCMGLDALNAALAKANDSLTAAQVAKGAAKAATDAALAAQAASTEADTTYATDRAAALQAFIDAFPDAVPNARVKAMLAAPGVVGGIDPAILAILLQLAEQGAPYFLQLMKLLFHVP